MDCMWIWMFEWIAYGYGYGYDGDTDVDMYQGMVMRCSKKLQYILAWDQMMPYSIFKRSWGFETWE